MLSSVSSSIFWTAIGLICGALCIQAQQPTDKWRRAYTSEGFITDIDPSSLRFEPEKIVRVQSRTIVSEPISLQGNTEPKYKTALQTIDFKLNANQYRLAETVLLDIGEKVLQRSTANDWRNLKSGGVMEGIFRAVEAFLPFGVWRVDAYRFAEGNLADAELKDLIGTLVSISSERVDVGTKACTAPLFDDEQYTKEGFVKKLGVDPVVIGLSGESIETIDIKCERGWQPPHSMFIKVAEGEMLMLWNGVFLVLKLEGPEVHPLPSFSPTLKRQPA